MICLSMTQGPRRNFTVEDIAVIMFYSNLVLDPLVYGLGSRDFRDKIGKPDLHIYILKKYSNILKWFIYCTELDELEL